jgi:hypothetical protein
MAADKSGGPPQSARVNSAAKRLAADFENSLATYPKVADSGRFQGRYCHLPAKSLWLG